MLNILNITLKSFLKILGFYCETATNDAKRIKPSQLYWQKATFNCMRNFAVFAILHDKIKNNFQLLHFSTNNNMDILCM